MKRLTPLAASICVSACATFTPPQGHPVLDDRIKGGMFKSLRFVQFATTPERRVVLMNLTKNRMCAEPSPDAAENLSYSLSAALAAKKTDTSVDSSISHALQSASEQIFTRTQGIQFYRDGMFSLCLAFMNDAIDKPLFVALSEQLRDKAADLVAQELRDKANDTVKKKTPSDTNDAGDSHADKNASSTGPEQEVKPTKPSTPKAPSAPVKPGASQPPENPPG